MMSDYIDDGILMTFPYIQSATHIDATPTISITGEAMSAG
jgi:deoxyribodipyrimidine photolyase-like uncharacterized protein